MKFIPYLAATAILSTMMLLPDHALADGMENDAFLKSVENGVAVWRPNTKTAPPPSSSPNVPDLLGAEPTATTPTVIVKTRRVVVPRFRPAKARVVGFYSGYGKRIPFVRGFYSGNQRKSRSYVQGFYSGYKRSKRNKFPLERANGYRRSY